MELKNKKNLMADKVNRTKDENYIRKQQCNTLS